MHTAMWEMFTEDQKRAERGKPMTQTAYAVNERWISLAFRARSLLDRFWETERAAPDLAETMSEKERWRLSKILHREGAVIERTHFEMVEYTPEPPPREKGLGDGLALGVVEDIEITPEWTEILRQEAASWPLTPALREELESFVAGEKVGRDRTKQSRRRRLLAQIEQRMNHLSHGYQ
jgi:hypothetical protein